MSRRLTRDTVEPLVEAILARLEHHFNCNRPAGMSEVERERDSGTVRDYCEALRAVVEAGR